MHQHSFSQGLSSFFQCLAHGFGADAVHYLAFHQPIRQQLQRPGGPALRRLGADQGNQLGFIMAVQLLGTTVKLLLASQGPLQTLLHTAAAHPSHRGGARLQDPGNLHVFRGAIGLVLIAKQQDAGVSLLVSRRPSSGHQRHQFLLLILHQPYPVFLHHHPHPTSQILLGFQLHSTPSPISSTMLAY